MVKNFGNSQHRSSWNREPARVDESIYLLLRKMGGNPERARLGGLWRNWQEVVGEELAWTAPKGHKGDILLLWAEDSMEMQELSLLSSEILQRVNAWLKTEYFSRIKINLRNS